MITSRTLLIAATGICLSACATFSPNEYRSFIAEKDARVEPTFHGLPLRSGQLIVSDSGGADSLLLSLMSEQYTPFIHAGIVVIENDKPFVYEGFATIRPFLFGPPTDAMHGRIRRVTLEHYIKRQRVTAVFDPPAAVDKSKVAAFAQARHQDRTRFDPYFDWRDHTQMYCTEFAALALHAGGAELTRPLLIRENPSLRTALDWLKIAAPEIVTAGSLTNGTQRVALISRYYSVEQLSAYFAAKRELHRRFTTDQKLGNIWRWSWTGLKLRPEIFEFFRASRMQPQLSPIELAQDILGPLPQSDQLVRQ